MWWSQSLSSVTRLSMSIHAIMYHCQKTIIIFILFITFLTVLNFHFLFILYLIYFLTSFMFLVFIFIYIVWNISSSKSLKQGKASVCSELQGKSSFYLTNYQSQYSFIQLVSHLVNMLFPLSFMIKVICIYEADAH